MPTVPRVVARLNKYTNNPIQRTWAPYLPPWALIRHIGRRSGREYSTPVISARAGDDLYVAVLYGEGSDWVRNLIEAGGGQVERAGHTYDLVAPEVRDADDAPGMAGRLLGRVSGRVLRAELREPV